MEMETEMMAGLGTSTRASLFITGDNEVIRREEDGKCGTEIMRKRYGTLDKERQQELPCILQVNGGGVKDGRKRSGKMAEECKQALSYLFEVKGGIEDGRDRNRGNEETDEESSALSEMRKLGDGRLFESEEITQGMELERTSKTEREVLPGSFYTYHDHNSIEGRY